MFVLLIRKIFFLSIRLSFLLPSLLFFPHLIFQKGIMLLLMKIVYWLGLDADLCDANTAYLHLDMHHKAHGKNNGAKLSAHILHFTRSVKCSFTSAILAALQLDYGMALPCCNYVILEPNPPTLSCLPRPWTESV